MLVSSVNVFDRNRMMIMIMIMMIMRNEFATLVSLSGFMILEPIEHILALDVAVKAELMRDLLNLITARSSKP